MGGEKKIHQKNILNAGFQLRTRWLILAANRTHGKGQYIKVVN